MLQLCARRTVGVAPVLVVRVPEAVAADQHAVPQLLLPASEKKRGSPSSCDAAIPMHANARERRERTAGCRRPRWQACARVARLSQRRFRCRRRATRQEAMLWDARRALDCAAHALRHRAHALSHAGRPREPHRDCQVSYDKEGRARFSRPSGALLRELAAWLTRRRRLRCPLRQRLPRPRPPAPRALPRPRPQRPVRRRVLRGPRAAFPRVADRPLQRRGAELSGCTRAAQDAAPVATPSPPAPEEKEYTEEEAAADTARLKAQLAAMADTINSLSFGETPKVRNKRRMRAWPP
jgi:hypothetical protein